MAKLIIHTRITLPKKGLTIESVYKEGLNFPIPLRPIITLGKHLLMS